MTIWNLGSINIDRLYRVKHLPVPGETLAASEHSEGLGGKGANMSVAAARAAAHVVHVGAVGSDGRWAAERLLEYGVDTRCISEVDGPTGHAIIAVDAEGENNILLWPGANGAITDDMIGQALSQAASGDWLLMQNETSGQTHAAQMGRALGLKVAYAAAPFDAEAVRAVLPVLDLLVMNAVEAEQLSAATGQAPDALGVQLVIVTKGADGCTIYDGGVQTDFPAIPVEAVDTTGAGDTFTGYVVAGLDRGELPAQAVTRAGLAAAIMVTRVGTADVIPDLKDIEDARL
ncbi:MAG: ribokinase [Pseudomonadota bacterium]